REGDDQARLVGERHERRAGAELATERAAALREDDFGSAAGVLDDADVAHPDAVREARAQRLRDRLLPGEAHGEETLRPSVGRVGRELLRHEDAARELLAVARARGSVAIQALDVDADPEDHGATLRRTARTTSRVLSGRPPR